MNGNLTAKLLKATLKYIEYLKYKFGQIGSKIKASLNLHEYSHFKQY